MSLYVKGFENRLKFGEVTAKSEWLPFGHTVLGVSVATAVPAIFRHGTCCENTAVGLLHSTVVIDRHSVILSK